MRVIKKMRGVSTSVIFVLVVIGIFVLSGLVVFWKWVEISHGETSELACKLKQRSYCTGLINNDNPNWDEISPKKGCEKYGIVKPSYEECKKLVQ